MILLGLKGGRWFRYRHLPDPDPVDHKCCLIRESRRLQPWRKSPGRDIRCYWFKTVSPNSKINFRTALPEYFMQQVVRVVKIVSHQVTVVIQSRRICSSVLDKLAAAAVIQDTQHIRCRCSSESKFCSPCSIPIGV